MVIIEYKRTVNQIVVKMDKQKPMTYSTCPDTVNSQALTFVKRYFTETIKKLCDERINAIQYAIYRDDLDKSEFFMRVNHTIDGAMQQPTWENYLSTCINQMRTCAPSRRSRFYPKYIFRIDELERTLKKYSNTKLYYEVSSEQTILDFFDTQAFERDYSF